MTKEFNSEINNILINSLDIIKKREICQSCRRPIKVCWCRFLPSSIVEIKSYIFILQHPYEESRCLKTAAMLQRGLGDHCKIIQNKKFIANKYPEIDKIINLPNTIFLYPSSNSIELKIFASQNVTTFSSFNIIVLDGTWHQARSIFYQNKYLHNIQQVHLEYSGVSKYVIRTQPTDNSLSTVESVALAIDILEQRNDIYNIFMKPLEAMCNFQLEYGAVPHQSKEHRNKDKDERI